jgi:hypothetical protein
LVLTTLVSQFRVQEGQAMIENRRSKRLPLTIPVRVYGRTPDDHPFRDITETNSVNVYGGLLPLAPKVKPGQTLTLVNSITEEARECRVISVEPAKRTVAVEFTKIDGDFWHVYDPPVEVKAPRPVTTAGATAQVPAPVGVRSGD